MRTLSAKEKTVAAVVKLIQDKSLHDITVSEVVSLADISRSTFYRNYHDVYAVFEEMVDGFAKRTLEYMLIYLFSDNGDKLMSEEIDFSHFVEHDVFLASDSAVVDYFLQKQNYDVFHQIIDSFRQAVCLYAEKFDIDMSKVDYYTKFSASSLFFGYLDDYKNGNAFNAKFIKSFRLLDVFNLAAGGGNDV